MCNTSLKHKPVILIHNMYKNWLAVMLKAIRHKLAILCLESARFTEFTANNHNKIKIYKKNFQKRNSTMWSLFVKIISIC